MRPGYFEFDIASEDQDFSKAIASQPEDLTKAVTRRTLESKLILDPFTLKSLVQLLQNVLAQYESTFGQIRTKQQHEEVRSTDPVTMTRNTAAPPASLYQ
jgi:uncharacterized protein DUF3467